MSIWDYLGMSSKQDWMNMVGPDEEDRGWWQDEILDWENLCASAEDVWAKNEYLSAAFGPVMSVEPIGALG